MGRLEDYETFENPRSYDNIVQSRKDVVRHLSTDVKVNVLANYWPYNSHEDSDENLYSANGTFWANVRSIGEFENCIQFIHDGLLLRYVDHIETTERCVSMLTFWLGKMRESQFKYTLNHYLPEWIFDHLERVFSLILGTLALAFNTPAHELSDYKNGERMEALFQRILIKVAEVGDIPHNIKPPLVSTSDRLGKDDDQGDEEQGINTFRTAHPWIWSNILKMLLYAVDRWFYTSIDPNDVRKVAEQAIQLLINAFIIASHESFPEVLLWQEFQLLCRGIIHIDTICKEWKAICETLTVQQLKRMYGDQYCGAVARNTQAMHDHMKLPSIISMMDDVNIFECWARFIVLLGNPASLMNDTKIQSQRIEEKHLHRKRIRDVREFSDVKARAIYPRVCLLMIQGIRCIVNAMLSVGLPNSSEYDGARPDSPDKPFQALLNRTTNQYKGPTRPIYVGYRSAVHSAPSTIDWRPQREIPLKLSQIPSGNSVLRLLGDWLFDSTAIIGKMDYKQNFYKASAEALGTLIYIFTHSRNDEPFEKRYMNQFVMRLIEGLKCGKSQLHDKEHKVTVAKEEILVKILQQSGSLFKVDLPGINALVSSYVSMIELILSAGSSTWERRRDAIEILSSVLCLPLRYPSIPLEDTGRDSELHRGRRKLKYMGELWGKSVEILMDALKLSSKEDDLQNKSQIMKALYILLLDKRYNPKHAEEDPNSPTMKSMSTSLNKTTSNNSISMGDVDEGEISVYGLWIEMIKRICDILQQTSQNDVKFWYTPFGILCGMAGIFPFNNKLKEGYDKTITLLCDYIECCCNKPTTKHSEDLHTMIVAAFHCLTTWCLSYPDLYQEEKCLFRCLQVIELAVSKMSSYNHDARKKILKGDKNDNPISKRVGDRAVFLQKKLSYHNDRQSGFCERDLIRMWRKQYPEHKPSIRYLVLEGSTILCLINPPPAHSREKGNDTPLLYGVARDPDTGISAFKFKYERDAITGRRGRREKVPRPRPRNDPWDDLWDGDLKSSRNNLSTAWPKVLSERYPNLRIETKTLDELKVDISKTSSNYKQIREIRNAIKAHSEEGIYRGAEPPPPPDLQEPEWAETVDSARIFLAHIGILTPKMFAGVEEVRRRKGGNSGGVVLDESVILLRNSRELDEMLLELDGVPVRDCHTVVVLYMKQGQNKAEEILRNRRVFEDNRDFQLFVQRLGNRIIDVGTFTGWTGLRPFRTWSEGNPTNDCPAPRFPFYSDSYNEISFLVPNMYPRREESEESPTSSPDPADNKLFEEELSAADVPLPRAERERSYYQQDLLRAIEWENGNIPAENRASLTKVIVIWAESFDDTRHFGDEHLALNLNCQKDSRVIIFVHPLRNGLYKTSVFSRNPLNKFNTAGLLDEGEKVVSAHILPIVVRETVLAIRTSAMLELTKSSRHYRRSLVHRIAGEHGIPDEGSGYFNIFFNHGNQ